MIIIRKITAVSKNDYKGNPSWWLNAYRLYVLAPRIHIIKMSINTIKKNIHSLDWGEFIIWESRDNPFAKIACWARTLQPTMCDGTCNWCKKRRQEYMDTTPTKRRSIDIISSWWDPDMQIAPIEHYRESLEDKIRKLEIIKREIVERRLSENRLEQIVVERMRILISRLTSPEKSWTTLH